jgi:hypothetical protein
MHRQRKGTLMTRFVRQTRAVAASLAAAAISAGVMGFGVTSAFAAPSNAPDAVSGPFDCGAAGAGTFVVNSGKANAPTTWNVAHLTFASGRTAVFQPRAFDLTFTSGGQSFTQIASHNGTGSTVCNISADLGGGGTLSGTVTGKIS